ncbi:MAG: hypothetical protein KAH57_09620, partial [Thermoplasmata archaeon]|nr:hypothetical protein [Thermoplasmata archaeon]
MQIIDSINALWGDDLKRVIKPDSKLKIATSCFTRNGKITEEFCKELAKRQPLRVVSRDFGFKDDSVKINVEPIFKLMSPH